jgi:hypothetical protein
MGLGHLGLREEIDTSLVLWLRALLIQEDLGCREFTCALQASCLRLVHYITAVGNDNYFPLDDPILL